MITISNDNLYKLTLYSSLIKTIFITIISIIMVPITLKYFGSEKYGIWNVINSFLIYLSMTNLGLNSAASILINKNSNFNSKIEILKKSFKLFLVIVPIILIVLALSNYIFPNWVSIINPPKNIEYEAKLSSLILVFFSVINLPFSLVTSAINGFQKNHIDNFFTIISSLFSLVCVIMVINLNKDLIFFALINGVSVLFVNIIKTIYFYFLIYKKSNINVEIIEVDNKDTSYKVILSTGYRSMLGAIASMFVLNTDYIVIAKCLGLEFVTSYSITFKLYTTIFALIYIINSSIIPLIGKNFDNKIYIEKMYIKSFITITIFGGLLWIGVLAFGKTIIYQWVGMDGYAGFSVMFFLGAYSYIFAIVNLNYIMINTFNYIKGIAYITWLEGLLNLGFSIVLCKVFGLAGIAIGTFLGTFIAPFFLFPLVLKKRTSNLINQDNLFLVKHLFFSITPCLIIAYFINKIENDFFLVFFLTVLLCLFYFSLSYLCLSKPQQKIKTFFLS